MKFEEQFAPTLEGSLLVAHPNMKDPNFRNSVILLSNDSKEGGAMGVAINRPLGQTLSEYNQTFENTPLASVPLYLGGPVEQNIILLAGWQFLEEDSVFKFHFGITQEVAAELIMYDPSISIRGYLGYAGWSHKQLQEEIKGESWIVSSVKNLLKHEGSNAELWRTIVSVIKPELLFLTDEPDDRSLN